MSHKGIRLLLEDTAKSLGDGIGFDYARTSEYNKTASDQIYPMIVLDPLTSVPTFSVNNTTNFTKTWAAQLAFYDLDKEDSTQAHQANILDKMDDLVDQFINRLNTYQFGGNINSDNIVITGMSQQPFIKATSAILTGFILTMQIQVTDNFNYCGLDC